MRRYEAMFARLATRGEGAFVPFLMLGDPDLETAVSAVDALVSAGADAVELGLPFSDPVADGPVIQGAAQRALASGSTPARCFAGLARIRARHPQLPVGLLVYANLVVHAGIANFYSQAHAAGVDSVLIADVPGTELGGFAEAARVHEIEPVLIAPPAAQQACIARIAALGAGYTYVLGRSGVTGTDRSMLPPERSLIAALHAAGAPPALVGFGLSTPAHMRAAIAAGAAGGIVGSAIVRGLEAGIDAMAGLARGLKAATRAA